MPSSDSESVQKMSGIISSGPQGVVEGFELSHPLLCPPVLQIIFNTLSLDELKMCRLVCQRWNDICLLLLKNNSMKPVVRICLTDEKRLEEFLDIKTGISDFQHFKVTFPMESESILGQFMTKFKNHIKDVTFVIGKNGKDAKSNSNMADKFLSFLAQNSSTWESFGIEINEESSKIAPSTPFESYEVNWSKLKSLSIKKVQEFPIFIPILEKATELERLVVVDGPLYSTFHGILQNLIPTLIEFELIGFSGRGDPFSRVNELIPSFTKLKRLKIGGLETGYQLMIPYLPELCELSLNGIMFFRFENTTVFSNLTFLDYGNCSIREEEFKEFSNIFPNLKKLYVNCIIARDTQPVWKYFQRIEELKVLGCQNMTDGGFIGFDSTFSKNGQKYDPRRGAVNWTDVYLFNKQPNQALDEYMGIQCLHPYLISELKKVTIAFSKISNMSVIRGLLKCKSLKSIQLLSPSPYVTKDILVWMADELNLMELSIDVSSANLDWRSSKEAIYFRNKHPNSQLIFPYFPTIATTIM